MALGFSISYVRQPSSIKISILRRFKIQYGGEQRGFFNTFFIPFLNSLEFRILFLLAGTAWL